MRAVVVNEFGVVPVVAEVPDPAPPPAGVVIEVASTGLCRSDWHGWIGHDSDIALPHVPGHELAGVIAAVGPAVRSWRPGQRVTTPFVCACGRCASCMRGELQVCDAQFQPGFTHWGSFAERVALDRADLNLVAVPDGVDLDTAASLGCRFATAYRAVVQLGRPREGDWVAVHGCGGVGLSAVMIAASRGARVIAVDVSGAALALAESVGAQATVNGARTDVVEAIRDLTGGGAALSVDALGSVPTAQSSIRCLRTRGRHVQVGLMAGDDAMATLPMDAVVAGELEVLGSHGMAAHAYPALLAEILDGTLAPEQLIQRRITLGAAPEALAAMNAHRSQGITMIHPTG